MHTTDIKGGNLGQAVEPEKEQIDIGYTDDLNNDVLDQPEKDPEETSL